ncbi:sugar transferase [Ulvibacter antarcticus]|uniref:Lipopolysaccharide/colanic/teichoic acid biosynthesis glycosyltransferase n=1 Tax=Ulvibacter antarcticus TaxID=442714 RepID=A0A3L9YJ46_9FLAO|nr:sugar transferase [Ulvibacter antarcticus]RMA57958.1 lipopolysaccharide/colanic/teichoic acid biosynthesis glycosyltransferase [Ulvibacter antarcticus]
MLSSRQHLTKRIFDISISIVLLLFAIIPLILLLVIATLDFRRNGFFVQKRIGRFGKPFSLYKIRTLTGNEHYDIFDITNNETKLGHWMRSTKLDELPQLINVLIGDMSLVGPRPDIEGYADQLTGDDRIILSVRPGLTGPATIKYKNEEQLLSQQEDPNKFNNTVIWPDKVAINKNYIRNWSLQKDIYYLYASVVN